MSSASFEDVQRGHLLTEQVNPASTDLDALSTEELVAVFVAEDRKPQDAVAGASAALAQAIEAIAQRLQAGGRLFYLGAGTSGRLGVLDAAECPPTFCSSPELVQGVLAGGSPALLRSSEGLEDRFEAGQADLEERNFGPLDALVGIAAGGTTPYVHGALRYANCIGALRSLWPAFCRAGPHALRHRHSLDHRAGGSTGSTCPRPDGHEDGAQHPEYRRDGRLKVYNRMVDVRSPTANSKTGP